jgi:hypothetical protein
MDIAIFPGEGADALKRSAYQNPFWAATSVDGDVNAVSGALYPVFVIRPLGRVIADDQQNAPTAFAAALVGVVAARSSNMRLAENIEAVRSLPHCAEW